MSGGNVYLDKESLIFLQKLQAYLVAFFSKPESHVSVMIVSVTSAGHGKRGRLVIKINGEEKSYDMIASESYIMILVPKEFHSHWCIISS